MNEIACNFSNLWSSVLIYTMNWGPKTEGSLTSIVIGGGDRKFWEEDTSTSVMYCSGWVGVVDGGGVVQVKE